MEKYRFDDSFEKVYELSEGAHFFIGSYFALGITSKMSDKQKTGIVEQELFCNELHNEY